MSLFNGFSAFPLTPTDANGRVNAEEVAILLERLINAGVDSIGFLGSTGGYAYLSQAERMRAVKTAVEVVAGRVPLIVGVGAIRTDQAQALAKDAEAAGADGLLLAPVSYAALLEEEAFEHYRAVGDATDLPLCVYNNPGTTHFNFSIPLLQRLSHLPTVAAVKMPLPKERDFQTEIAKLREGCSEDFQIGYSGDGGCAAAMLSGSAAWYSSVGGLLPKPFLKLRRAAQAGDRAEIERLNEFFKPLWSLITDFGGLRVSYAGANIMGLTQAQPHRPVLPLEGDARKRVDGALKSLEQITD